MATNNPIKRLEEIVEWYYQQKPTISDVVKRQMFQEKTLDNILDVLSLFAVELYHLRKMKDITFERPSFQPNSISTFIRKKEVNPDDPELGIRE